MDLSTCQFCLKSESTKLNRPVLFESDYFVVVKDIFPVSLGHTLIISRSHRRDFFDLNKLETDDLSECILSVKKILDLEFEDITGYNIGMNCGASAGQTVFHFHLHLIPRRDGDCDSPKGGVRGVIPDKMSY